MTHAHSILKRYAVRILACLCVIELFVIPFDFGRYSQTLDDYGLVGFATLPSVLIFQFGYFVSAALLLFLVIRAGLLRRFRIIAGLFGLALAGYCLSLLGLYAISGYGEFGYGAAFFLGAFGFIPSALFIYFVIPFILVYVSRKSCA